MPSLGYGVVGWAAEEQRGIGLVLAEKQFGQAAVGPGPGQQLEVADERMGEADPRAGRPARACGPVAGEAASTGLAAASTSSSQAQVLRYQAVGSTCRVAGSGPALVTRIRISRSSGLALA